MVSNPSSLVLPEAKRPLRWPHLNVRKLKFGRSTPRSAGRSTPPSTDISWSRMAIGRSTPQSAGRSTPSLVLTSNGQAWQFHIATVTAYLGRSTGRSTPPIKHRCLEYHYTKLGRSTPLSIEHRCLEYHYTKLDRPTGRCPEYHYTKHGRSTPNPSNSA